MTHWFHLHLYLHYSRRVGDTDGGGTINSTEEMSQLCMNLLFKLEVKQVGGHEVNKELVTAEVTLTTTAEAALD